MSKSDILIIIFAVILLGAMIITIFFGGSESRHGVGLLKQDGLDDIQTSKSLMELQSQSVAKEKVWSIYAPQEVPLGYKA